MSLYHKDIQPSHLWANPTSDFFQSYKCVAMDCGVKWDCPSSPYVETETLRQCVLLKYEI